MRASQKADQSKTYQYGLVSIAKVAGSLGAPSLLNIRDLHLLLASFIHDGLRAVMGANSRSCWEIDASDLSRQRRVSLVTFS